MNISPVNEESILIRFSHDISEEIHLRIKSMYMQILELEGVLSVVPSYNSIMIYYDLLKTDYESLKARVLDFESSPLDYDKKIVVRIPVCYDLGLDLERVSKHTGLSLEEVIESHSSRDYLIYMIGFTPGFPYLGGMDERLTTPRLEVPRTKIQAGSVGIGGKQTGIYPLATPGGWNIIGKTPLKLYDQAHSKTLLKMGQYVRFVPISQDEYHRIEKAVQMDAYEIEVVSC
ncbi:5-oxoprolinase subunit PxpB [Acidaminobacter sp. JC074]|uniref:5-oxoprolinase subunit PxpB n=1 Tax=Acidaminobacter sp. JC074 TaxID=2530199 RepID=UPI001F0F34DF|nr:5-oxoprolinase subunit PxpB [Acidaminobacter sp. JC074]MCH4890559.1 5-oxoprolinase subunit PxpB [Acidaminobacter sp. JC074]